MKDIIKKLKEEAWYNRIDDKFEESLQEDCQDFIENNLNQRDWKIQVWGTSEDGEGMVQDLGIYEDFDGISLHTNMFNNVEISFEQVFELDKKD